LAFFQKKIFARGFDSGPTRHLPEVVGSSLETFSCFQQDFIGLTLKDFRMNEWDRSGENSIFWFSVFTSTPEVSISASYFFPESIMAYF
jgi:hypothetical protein